MTSTYILTAFTIEVWLSIVHPIIHRRFVNRRLVTLTIIIFWLLAIVYQLSILIGVSRVVNGLCYVGYEWSKVRLPVGFSSVFIKIILPVCCFSICYISIIRKLRKTVKVRIANAVNANNLATSNDKDQYSKARVNVAIMLFYSVILHVSCWSGNHVVIFMASFNYYIATTDIIYQMLLLATCFSSCINPIIYVLRYEKFRRAAKYAIGWK